MADDDEDFDTALCEANASLEVMESAISALLTALDDKLPAIRTLMAETMGEEFDRIQRSLAETPDDTVLRIRAVAFEDLLEKIDPENKGAWR